MIDRIRDEIGIRAIGIVEKLDNLAIQELCAKNISKKLLNGIKAAGISPKNPFEMEILMQYAKFKLENALKSNSVEFNGIYFEKEVPRNIFGDKKLYSYKDGVKRVNSFGARNAYPSEVFSLIIAGLEGKLNFEQKAVADGMLKSYGEWLGAVSERKGNKLIVSLEDSANIEFDIKGIPSQQFVDLCIFPEEFIIKMYSRCFGDLPEEMRVGGRRAQVYLSPDGLKWPLGRGNCNLDYFSVLGYCYDSRASRWVVSRKNFSIGNGDKK